MYIFFKKQYLFFDCIQHNDKQVVFKDISWYFLTTGLDAKRREHMHETFKEYNIKEVNPVLTSENISKFQSGATGFLRMIDYGLREQDIGKPFQPFVILEDDVSKYRTIPHSIKIPKDCDLLYIGISTMGIRENCEDMFSCTSNNNHLFFTHTDEHLIKVQNMLSAHGILVCSPNGANLITRCISEAFFKNIIWDIPLAYSQSLYHIYALKEPLVYQDEKYNGQQSFTKINFKDRKKSKGDFIPTQSGIHHSFSRETASVI